MLNRVIFVSASLAFGLVNSAVALAGQPETIQCKLPGCTLTCSSKDQPSKTYGPAKDVIVEIHQGGVIKYELNRGIAGKQTVYVGPDSYMCSLNQP